MSYTAGNAGYGLHKEILDVSPCNQSNFKHENFTEVQDVGIESYYCINDQEKVKLNGLYLMENYTFMVFQIAKCVNTTENNNHCNSSEEIDHFFDTNSEVQLVMRRQSFSATSFDNPIKDYIDGTMYDYVDSRYKKIGDIYLSDTEIYRVDDPYMIEGETEATIPEINFMKMVM